MSLWVVLFFSNKKKADKSILSRKDIANHSQCSWVCCFWQLNMNISIKPGGVGYLRSPKKRAPHWDPLENCSSASPRVNKNAFGYLAFKLLGSS